ncbi:tubulin-tyrosine ligase family-domain-containing protein [Melampsora americana]|nr:tubulin-tyrosine ligase family-domain-containing protein [Melampsora americana]
MNRGINKMQTNSPKSNKLNINYQEPYTLKIIKNAIKNKLPEVHIIENLNESDQVEIGVIQIADYDFIDWDIVQRFPKEVMVNAYPIRKALIRKNYLSKTLYSYFNKFIPETWRFELAYFDELDELFLDELYDLKLILNQNLNNLDHQEWFILKPALAERGQGIRLFNSIQGLEDIFIEFDQDEDEEEGDDEDQNGVSSSKMRHWVIQRYLSNPLLIGPPEVPLIERRKHHLRVYVLAVGALSVYVYKDILALFAPNPYTSPTSDTLDLSSHLTNTCLQTPQDQTSTVHLLSTLAQEWNGIDQEMIEKQVDEIVKKSFLAAKKDPINFQIRTNCWEIFGFDFLIDNQMKVWLLEVNACPDFKQTGETLSNTILGLFEGALEIAVKPFVEHDSNSIKDWDVDDRQVRFGYRKCLDINVLGGVQ